eukprot:s49_g76.t1
MTKTRRKMREDSRFLFLQNLNIGCGNGIRFIAKSALVKIYFRFEGRGNLGVFRCVGDHRPTTKNPYGTAPEHFRMDRTCCRRRMVASKRGSGADVSAAAGATASSEAPEWPAKRPRGLINGAKAESAQAGEERNSEAASSREELFEGFRRSEVVRLLKQTLSDLGFHATRHALEVESGPSHEEALAGLRTEILAGQWDEALQIASFLSLDLPEVAAPLRRLLLEQKCCDLHEKGHTQAAQEVFEEMVAEEPQPSTLDLESVVEATMFQDRDRHAVLERVESLLPELPPRRLPELLWQAVRYQHFHCLYSDLDPTLMSQVPCLVQNYSYSPPPLPTHCVRRLDHHRDEVWFASISHDGRLLATSSKDESIVIWERNPSGPGFNAISIHIDPYHMNDVSITDGLILQSKGAMFRSRTAQTPLGYLSRQLGLAAVPTPPSAWASKYRVAIIGGGSAGVSVASQLRRKLPKNEHGQIAVIEPRDHHLYMPYWTMVGGLGLDVSGSMQKMEKVMPTDVEWIKEKCLTFQPEQNKITLASGHEIEYDILVVAAGLQQNFNLVPGYHVCRSAIHRQQFVTDLPLEYGRNTFTIMRGQFISGGRLPMITATPATHVVQHAEVDISNFNQVIEACSGIGAVSTCLPFCNAKVACYVDSNEKFSEWLDRKNQAPVVHGDIGDLSTVQKVAEITQGFPSPLNAGIACQPFSALGDQREQEDPRSNSLPGLLRMGYWLRSPLITMECTREAHESHWVQSLLKSFADQTGYVLHQNVLSLHHTWPAHRTRWWACLSMPMLGITSIPDMPQMDFIPSIMHVMQIHAHLPPEESRQLALSIYELRHFHDQPKGITASIINVAKAMPTATHSWGSQLGPCHCGCRSKGFSQARLSSKGLYGVLIPLGSMVKAGEEWFHGMRHPHPKEVAFLNALDPRHLDSSDPFTLKFLLAGVGQLASPLQGAWVFSNMFYQMMKNGFPVQVQPPRHVMANLCRELLRAREATWPDFMQNRSTVLFEREMNKIDHPLTTLHQDDVDPFVAHQLGQEETHSTQMVSNGSNMNSHLSDHAEGHAPFVHETDQTTNDVESEMPNTQEMLAVLEPVVIIQDFPVDIPFRVAERMQDMPRVNVCPDETPCLTHDFHVDPINPLPACLCPQEPKEDLPTTHADHDHPQSGPVHGDNRASTEATALTRTSEAGAGHIRALDALDRTGHACDVGVGSIRASEAGVGSIRAYEAGVGFASAFNSKAGVGSSSESAFEAGVGHIRASEAGVGSIRAHEAGVGSASEFASEAGVGFASVPTSEAGVGHIQASDEAVCSSTAAMPLASTTPAATHPSAVKNDSFMQLPNMSHDVASTSSRADKFAKSALHDSLASCETPTDMPVKRNTDVSAKCAFSASADMSNTGVHEHNPEDSKMPAGVAKSLHAMMFTHKQPIPGVDIPAVESMTTKIDPLETHDPWMHALRVGHSPGPQGQCSTSSMAYGENGGLNQFASCKRSAGNDTGPPPKRSTTAHGHIMWPPTVQAPSTSPVQETWNAISDAAPKPSLTVWVGQPSTPLHKVKISEGETVGQLAVAESKLDSVPTPVRTLTAMGSFLPVYTQPHDQQIILIEEGGQDHETQYPQVRGHTRQSALWRQQGWVGDDEMAFYLSMLGHPNLTTTTAPLLMENNPDDAVKFERWLNHALDLVERNEKPVKVHTACLLKNHWFPVSLHIDESKSDNIHLTTTIESLPIIRQWATEALGEIFQFHYKVPKEAFPADCGFQTLAWIMAQELGEAQAYPMQVEEAIKWRELFARHLINYNLHDSDAASVRFGGMIEPHEIELSSLLQQHGVSVERAPKLAQQLLQVLGVSSVKQTLGSPRPWADLKTKASAQKPPIQLVLATELQTQIANRLRSGKPMGGRKNKQSKKQQQQKWSTPQASQVQIPDGIFQQQDGAPLGQITLHQLQMNHRGIAIVNIQDAIPFFNLQKPLSAEGVGMLVLEFQDEQLPMHHQVIRFPASCPETQEPMILSAALIQLGQQQVTRVMPPKPTSIDQVDTVVLRAVLYKDQAASFWKSVLTKPVKYILSLDHFTGVSHDDLLDIWDRQWLSKQFQKMKPDEADLFSFVLRVKATCVEALMKSNSKDGLYFEPRTQSGRSPCPDHRVVWIPRKCFHDAVIAKQATPQPTSIARSADRFGLRTLAQHAEEVHKQHRPDVAYLDGATTKVFRIAPLPFGSTKQSLQKVFAEWEWSARPSHTQGLTPDKQGLVWIAHATEQPNFYIYTMEHGDVLISEVQSSKPVVAQNQGAPVASVRTLRHLTAASAHANNTDGEGGQVDPLQANDPWASAYKGQVTKQVSPSASQMAAIESNVEKRVLHAIKDHLTTAKNEDAPMEAQSDSRLSQLETQVHMLTDNLNQLTGSMSSFKQQQQTHNTQVAHQALTAVGGTHVGTAFVTNLPSRKLQMQCTSEQWNQARFTMNTFLCNNVWFHGAVIYGYAHRAFSTEVRQATDELLEVATQRIVQNLKGPRFIMGDFNQEGSTLQQPLLWEKLGWREVQTLQLERFGDPIAKTCKQTTTKDYIWISPEMVQFFQRAEVINHVYPDHGALLAHFTCPDQDVHVFHWRKPKKLPWNECQGTLTTATFELPTEATPEASSIQIAQELESRMHAHLVRQGHRGLFESQRGRCQTMDTRKILSHASPLKASRNGDAQPEYQGQNLQHQRWFTQVRRLESLGRLYKAQPWNANQLTHATREWRAVLAATGFSNFRQWWKNLACKHHDAPAILPEDLPDEQALNAISLTVQAEVRSFERMLQSELIAKAKHNRVMHPNKVYKDFAKPAVSPVCILQDSAIATITEVDPSDNSITLNSTTPFWPGEIVTSAGPQLPIISCDDKIWLETVDNLCPGQEVRQEKFVGQLEEMFKRFQLEWQSRWDRHLQVPEEQWDPVLEFFRLAHPPGPEQTYRPITREAWLRTLRKKKSTAAQGPDGWTRQDLINLPDDLTDAIVSLLNRIEDGSMEWPQQWLTGLVHSLEKFEQPESVSGYRPITIFSLVYRTWSSLRSKEILRHVLPMVSSRSYGNLPQRCTTNMWMTLQLEIEANMSAQQPTCGAVLDIVKCFNHLPRTPLFGVLHHLGVSSRILHAWSRALCKMERRFCIRGSVGPPLRSSTGMAEGCSLSVVGMVACNQLISSYVSYHAPRVQLFSYVDNLELATTEPHSLMRGVQKLTDVLELLDLEVDKKKTYLWSNEGSFRKIFLQNGFNVKTAARDIGAHMQYTKQATNFTITQKIEAFKPRWKTLALSPAPYDQKLRATKMMAFPNMLHGISSVHLGDQWYEDVRTGSVRALQEHRPGCSPPIHLSWVEHPSADPGYHALWVTITQCRQYMTPEQCLPQFSRLATTCRKRPEVGPCSVVMHRLSKVFWTWDDAGFFRDVWGCPIDLWNMPIQELAQRATEAWRYKIACESASRHTFVGLSQCSASFTTEAITTHPRDKAILRSALNGTFFTADHLRHRDTPGDTRCRLCLHEDSLYHRNWECEALSSCRSSLTEEQQRIIKAMPPATHLQGWFPEPTEVHAFRHQLGLLPDYADCLIPQHCQTWPPDGPAHYFTDGSCLRPQDKIARLCGWGVTVSHPQDLWTFLPVASGCLPGRLQTVVRAELTASMAAVLDARHKQHFFCIWSDNERVVTVLRILFQHPEHTWTRKSPNHDLLNQLASEFREVAFLCKGIFKVASHQCKGDHLEPAERWSFTGNDSADHLASQAFQAQPRLMEVWHHLCQSLDRMRSLRDGMHIMMLNIGLTCLTSINNQSTHKPPPAKSCPKALTMTQWKFPQSLPPEAKHYMISETPALLRWIDSLHDDSMPVQRWSWWQLFLAAWLEIPQFGPWYHVNSKQWKPGTSQPPESFLRKARWFSKYLHKLSKVCKVELPLQHAMPCGSVIAFWTATLPVQVHPSRTDNLDHWLGKHLPCLKETMGKNSVASIYSLDYSPIVWQNIQALNSGKAIFTNPSTAVNCGGAPQKIAYLAEAAWRKRGVRNNIDIEFITATPGIFACPEYRVALEKQMAAKGISPSVKTNLIEVDGDKKIAVFEKEGGEIVTKEFDFLHVTPPMSAPDFVKNSPLANAVGFVDVDKETCQHNKYPNVFALGDCSSLPTSKTYSAVSSQAPVVVSNVQSLMEKKEATRIYDGYTACPVLLGDSQLMLAEFNGYTMEAIPTFWPLNQTKPNAFFYWLKRFVFEHVYWHAMPNGRWYGKYMFFEPWAQHKAESIDTKATGPTPSEHAALKAQVAAPSTGTSQASSSSSSDSLKPELFGVATPQIPGDVSLVGNLEASVVAQLAPRYKGWLYLNPAESKHFHRKDIEAAGCQVEVVPIPTPKEGVAGAEHAAADIDGYAPSKESVQCLQLMELYV